MAYQIPKTIKEVINSIQVQQYVLPSIQREFVWNTDQIETLFDSLMRGYPIGTFLFWQVDKINAKNFQFYKFLKEYHEKDKIHNKKFNIPDKRDIIAVLDGQQRMTSLYLALVGSYAYKIPHKAKNNPNAYPERKLHLNLLKQSDELEITYNFCFLTKEESERVADDVYWFDCHKILSFEDKDEIYDYLEEEDLSDTSKLGKEMVKFARNTLNRFYDVVHKDGTISFYMENSEELDKVLQIFIRINSRGTPLSYSDLLLSIATAQWKEKDARKVIRGFVDDINQIGDGFAFNKDIVLKNCLVLADFKDVRFKVVNFNKENMKIIERDWDKISSSFRCAVELVAQFGYAEKSLTATNAVIPISYFIYKNECEDKILRHSCHENDRKAIKEWLARVLLKGTFGGKPDSIYPGMRDLINKHHGYFPLQETISFYRGSRKSISFSSDEIDNLLELQYSKAGTYSALSLIYPKIDRSFVHHKDHIHPKSKFTKKEMRKIGVSDEEIDQFNNEMDGIANLQLLEGTLNMEKSDKPFKEWLDGTGQDKEYYLRLHHINPNQSLEFKDFLDFVAERKKTLKKLFMSALGVTTEEDEDE